MTREIDTTTVLKDQYGAPLSVFDLAVVNTGQVIEVPVTGDDGGKRPFTFKEAVFRVLCRIDPSTKSEEEKFKAGQLAAKVLAARSTVKLSAKEITTIREASGAQAPSASAVWVHYQLVQIMEPDGEDEPEPEPDDSKNGSTPPPAA